MQRFTLLTLILMGIYAPWANSQITIKGTITNSADGQPLPGVTILESKTSNGTIANLDGMYQLSVNDTNAVLNFSFIGYETQKIKVKQQRQINVVLQEDTCQHEMEPVYGLKPVIYLYPEKEQDISLQFKYSGTVMVTYPTYLNGWNVRAQANGTLTNKADNKEYSYLFWEGKRNYTEKETEYTSGYVVPRDSTLSFLQNIMPKMGLTPREYNEFIVFWLPQMLQNSWNFIYFRTGAEYNMISQNTVNPKPDVEIRVFMEFKKVNTPFKISPQIITTPSRHGFTLVEWGGSKLEQKITIKNEKDYYMIY